MATDYDMKKKKNMADAEAEDMAEVDSNMKSMMPPKMTVKIEVGGDDERSGEYVCPDCGKAAVKR